MAYSKQANYAGSMLQGAGTGAAAGAAFGPWGAAIGGGVGLVAGFFNAWAASEDEEDRKKILAEAKQQLGANYSQLQGMINEYYANNESIGSKEDINTYRKLIGDYNPYEFVYGEDTDGDGVADSIKEFDESKFDVNNYYAPNREALIEKTGDAVQARAAGAGIGRGTGAANQIATAVADKNEDLYKDALAAMNQDRQFAYNLWNAKIQQGQNRLNQLKSAKDTQLSLYGNLAEDYQNFQQSKLQTMMDLDKQKMSNDLTLTLASI